MCACVHAVGRSHLLDTSTLPSKKGRSALLADIGTKQRCPPATCPYVCAGHQAGVTPEMCQHCSSTRGRGLQQCQKKPMQAVEPMSDLSVRVCRLLGRCPPFDPSTLQQCQPPCLICLYMCVQATGQVSPFGPLNTAAVPAAMSDLSVRVCRLLGRCHPLDPSTLQQCQPPCLICLCVCAGYWAGVTLWTPQHCSSASPHA